MPSRFFDTSTLLYFFSHETKEADRTRRLLASGGLTSVQALNESVNVLIRKYRRPLDEIENFLGVVRDNLEIEPITLETHSTAVRLVRRYGYHIYDCNLLAAALIAGCTTFLSEDLQHGQVIDGRLTIENPFL